MMDLFHPYLQSGPILEAGDYLALPGRAALLGGPRFCRLLFFFVRVLSKCISSFICPNGCIYC